jgi:hypothetical protein
VVQDKMMRGGIMEYYKRQQISVPPHYASKNKRWVKLMAVNKNPTMM